MRSAVPLLDGNCCPLLDAVQRGLAYGDGVFETMRARDGDIALWAAHLDRLTAGCKRLALDAPPEALLVEERDRVLRDAPDAVLKLMVWREAAGHGYDPAGERATHRSWSTAPLPAPTVPMRVRWCELTLARQPALAGLKTLNRLEQVLARAEWKGGAWDEGLLCDTEGHAISAISGNLFAVIDHRLVTPALDQCGVAGVMRGWILAQRSSNESIEVRAILRDEIDRASEMFLTNAVRGIRAIGALGGRGYGTGAMTAAWIRRAREAGLMDSEDNSA